MGKLKSQCNLWSKYIIGYYSSIMIIWNTQQYLKENLWILSRYFTFSLSLLSFLLSLIKLSCTNEHLLSKLYRISYILSFCYVMYYIVSEICIGGRFLEDRFYCYAHQIISPVANESLIPYNLFQKAPEAQNLLIKKV